jgi:CheY-like chemotaxis protein
LHWASGEQTAGDEGRAMQTTHVCHKLILVVEDNFILSEILSTLLGADGFRVCSAGDVREALECLHGREKPDLIILDLMLPGKDGFAFLRERRQDVALAAIPVVVVSGAGDVREEVTALGAAAYLPKPVDAALLLQTVHRFCP